MPLQIQLSDPLERVLAKYSQRSEIHTKRLRFCSSAARVAVVILLAVGTWVEWR